VLFRLALLRHTNNEINKVVRATLKRSGMETKFIINGAGESRGTRTNTRQLR
jgi:hypothetical protein